ncbi:MAG: SDR family oxidoreductase [Rickettsiales bacterium]
MSSFSIKDKIVLLSGASGHIGSATRDYLRDNNAIVIAVSRNIEHGDDNYNLDITNDSERRDFINLISKKYGQISSLINNAYSGNSGKIEYITRKDFEDSLNIGLISPILFIKELLPHFSKNGASIVNIASMYGMVSPDGSVYDEDGKNNNPIYYGAGKAGLIQATKYLACHLASSNIRVNAISPGAFPRTIDDNSQNIFLNKLTEKTPMKKLGIPENLFGIIHLLISSHSSYITGTNIPVDGGWTAW